MSICMVANWCCSYDYCEDWNRQQWPIQASLALEVKIGMLLRNLYPLPLWLCSLERGYWYTMHRTARHQVRRAVHKLG